MPPRKKATAAALSPSAASDVLTETAAASDAPVEDWQALQIPFAAAEPAPVDAADQLVSADVNEQAPHFSPTCTALPSSSVASASPPQSPQPPAADLSPTPTKNDLNPQEEGGNCSAEGQFNLVFLGTGVSTTIPKLSHFLSGSCAVCNDAAARPFSKNRRNNVSALVIVPISPDEAAASAAAAPAPTTDSGSADFRDRFWNASSIAKTSRYICIDFSPTIRDSAMRFFPAAGCRSLDAVIFFPPPLLNLLHDA
jgi:hypothetical protein